jgi:hypothetical protein
MILFLEICYHSSSYRVMAIVYVIANREPHEERHVQREPRAGDFLYPFYLKDPQMRSTRGSSR